MVVGDFPLKGKIAVVTGAGSGINFAFATRAVERGARVLIADLKLTKEADDFIKVAEARDSVVFVRCDVRKRTDLEKLVPESEKHFGDVPDIWIAGAGVFEPNWSSFWDDTEDDGYAQVDINVNHPIKLTRIAIRSLVRKEKPGVVLVVASLAGFAGAFATPLYCATKHACVGLVRSLEDLDRAQDIKVTAIAPGFVETPMWLENPEKMARFGYSPAMAVKASVVADRMVELITDGKYTGGTCMEISTGEPRLLGTWNIPPPDASKGTTVDPAMRDASFGPILAKVRQDSIKASSSV